MKIYNYDTIFLFGKHRGKKLIDVISSDWSYINWCQEHLKNFILAEEMMYVLKHPNGEFQFSKLALESRQKNLRILYRQKDNVRGIELEQHQEIQNSIDQDELDDYDPFTEESGNYNNNPDFSVEPFDEY